MCLVDIYKESDPSGYNTVCRAKIWTGLGTLRLSLMIYVQPCLKANYLSSLVLILMGRYHRVVIPWLCMLVIESCVFFVIILVLNYDLNMNNYYFKIPSFTILLNINNLFLEALLMDAVLV